MGVTEYQEELFKRALTSDAAPSPELNYQIKQKMEAQMHSNKRLRMILRPVLAVLMVLILSGSAYAAWRFLSPTDVANRVGTPALVEAFASQDAIQINETKSQNGYDVTLLGLVSGSGLGGMDETLEAGRTYAVVAIARQEGSANTGDLQDESFFVSPLIHGQQPWKFNIASMGGGYGAFVEDGVLYRMIDCDSMELFADRGLSLIVSSTDFYSIEAYDYDEQTGLVTPNPDFAGVNLLFDLPLDTAKADHNAAQAYLDTLWDTADDEEPVDEGEFSDEDPQIIINKDGSIETKKGSND